jgi:hypothetical protein
MKLLILVVDDEANVGALLRAQFRRDFRVRWRSECIR